MAAVGGAVWTTGESGRLKLAVPGQSGANRRRRDAGSPARGTACCCKSVLGGTQAILAPPSSGPASDRQAGNPTELLLVLAPLIVEKASRTASSRFFSGRAARRARSAATCGSWCRCATWPATISKSRRLRQLAENQSLWRQLEALVQALHRSLDVRETAYADRQRRPADDRLRPRVAGPRLRRPLPDRSGQRPGFDRSPGDRGAAAGAAGRRPCCARASRCGATRATTNCRRKMQQPLQRLRRSVARAAGGRAAARAADSLATRRNATEGVPYSGRLAR